MNNTGSNRRKFERVVKSMPVRFRIIDGAKENLLTLKEYGAMGRDISEGGIFIEVVDLEEKILSILCSSYPKMNLAINLSGWAVDIKAVAEVVWRRREETPLQKRLGLGMRFVEVNAEEKGRLSTYIAAELEEQRKPTEVSFPHRIESSIIVKQPKEVVYDLLKHMEQFPQFMGNVKRVTVVEGMGNRAITNWEIEMEDTQVTWKQESIFDDKNMSIKFRMLEGDFGKYEGEWSLFQLLTGTEIRLSVIVDWGMPSWERHAGDILKEKAELILQKILREIKSRMWVEKVPKLVKFACLIHPLDIDLFSTFERCAKDKRRALVKKILEWSPAFRFSHVTGIQSLTGKQIDGELILCPLLPEQILNINSDFVLGRVIEAGKIAENLGARILGLGAYTSGVGRKGVLVAKALNIPVTTGTSYTIATVIEATLKAAKEVGIELSSARVVVIGATGTIGSTCSRILVNNVLHLTLVGRNREKLYNLANSIYNNSPAQIKISTDIDRTIFQNADIIITATNTPAELIDVKLLQPGTVVCDISLPRNISQEAANSRKDVLVIDGGVVKPPGDANFNFYYGLPPGLTYACMAETMILALEERYECYSIGGNISLDKVKEISQLASKHGFKLDELRSFGRGISQGRLKEVRYHYLRK